jgi:hypothetical protein
MAAGSKARLNKCLSIAVHDVEPRHARLPSASMRRKPESNINLTVPLARMPEGAARLGLVVARDWRCQAPEEKAH